MVVLRYTVSDRYDVYNTDTEKDALALLRRFVNRDDVFAQQQNDGTYRPIRRTITDEDLLGHLRGEHTLGVYQLKSGMVKWICFDIDAHVPGSSPSARSALFSLAQTLKTLEIPYIVELSGTPSSYHVWLFMSLPTDVARAHYFAHELVGGEYEHEVYPKQREDDPSKPYGNLVKLPLGMNLKNDVWGTIVPEPLVRIRTIDISNYSIPVATRDVNLVQTSQKIGVATGKAVHGGNTTTAMPMNVRPCLKRAIENHTQLIGAEGHTMRIAIVPEMRQVCGMNMDDITMLFTDQPDYNYSRTRQQVDSVYRYNRISCGYLRKFAGGYVADMCDDCLFRGFR